MEFNEVMKRARRMCMARNNCTDGCPVYTGGYGCMLCSNAPSDWTDDELNDFERLVTEWAANHPEA